MSQTLSNRLSIDQIARRWARETDNAGFGAEDIADDLVKAAELGEFEHTIYARANAPLGEYTYKEDWIDPKKSKTLKGEQPYVGPYRSALSMQDNRPVNSIDIVNYIKTRGTTPGATDQETRRIVARDIFLSVEGLRRWCEEPGFAEWAKLRGLSRPKFIDRASGDGPGQASDPPPTATCKPERHHDPLDDAALKTRIESVVAKARRKWRDPKKRPEIDVMAKDLARLHGRELGYKFETIRKILKGTYKTSVRLDIAGL